MLILLIDCEFIGVNGKTKWYCGGFVSEYELFLLENLFFDIGVLRLL